MDEFALCWNNFQDNIATGFQNLFDRGDLVDVSLACDGKILRAHKIVLAICSPYFQEMFITNPCKHPIIILKDVTYTVMSELLQFMYQGEVNVKHTELSSFMKIAETLQIKGLTTTQRTSGEHQQRHNSVSPKCNAVEQIPVSGSNNNVIETKINTSGYGKEGGGGGGVVGGGGGGGQKRPMDFAGEGFSIYPRKQMRPRTSDGQPVDEGEMHSADSMDHMAGDEVFLPPIPQISMGEPRFDLNNVKRENVDGAAGGRNVAGGPSFNLEYNSSVYLNKNVEYPNELHMANDFSKSSIHMDIPAGSNVTMLSTTSLLHGNCIFNRNNTVATQQGMKTYWLCKSYRITMCRARCITHQGRVISATGVHNHQPHMKGSGEGGMMNPLPPGTSMRVPQGAVVGAGIPNPPPVLPVTSQASQSLQMANLSPQQSLNVQQMHQQHQNHHHQQSGHHHQPHPNVMHNVLSHNNLMQLTNMNPIVNPNQHHGSMQQHQSSNLHAASNVQAAPVHTAAGHHLPSPTSAQQRSSVVHQQQAQTTSQEAPNMQQQQQHHSAPSNSQPMAGTPTSIAASPGVPSQQQQPTPPSEENSCQQQHEIPVSSASSLMSPTGGATFKMEHSM